MNLVEIYVSNITMAEEHKTECGSIYEVTADKDCYGRKEKQVTFWLGERDYESVKEKGFYLG